MDFYDKERSSKYLEGIFETAGEGILVVDANGHILRSNSAFDKLLGYEKGELKGMLFTEIAHKKAEVQKITSQIKLHHFQRSSEFHLEMELIDKEGNATPVRLHSILIKNDRGEVIEAIGMVEDLRKDKGEETLEQKIWETQENLQNVLANSGDAIMVADSNGRITIVNEALLQMLGYQEDEIMGRHLIELSPYEGSFTTTGGEEVSITEEYVNYQVEKASELFEKGKVTNYEIYFIRKDGKIVPVEATLSLLKDKKGERRGSVAICRDITERKRAENLTKLAYSELNQIFNTAANGMCVIDKDFNILRSNKVFSTLSGINEDKAIGKKCYEVLPGSLCHTPNCSLTRILNGEKLIECDAEKERIDGTKIPCIVKATPFLTPDGKLIGIVENFKDITKRKQAEETLKKSEERYHNLIEFANVGIITTEDGKIIQVNRRAEEIYGYSKDELIGKSPRILTLEKNRKKHREMLNELLRWGKTKKTFFEEEGVRKDGSTFPIEISYSLSKSKEKKDYSIIAIMRDITERRKKEGELRETKEFIEKVIENTADGIMICDPSGNIIDINSALKKITGLRKEELIGEHASILIPEDQETRKMFRDKAVELFEKGYATYELVLKRKDGKHVEVDINSSLIKDEKENYIAGVSIFRDISERKRAEKKIRETRKFLENVIESSLDGILIVDPMGNILSVNSAIENISGYSRNEIINQHTSFFAPKDKETRRKYLENINQLFTSGSTCFEAPWGRKDGSRIEVEQSLSFIKNDQGENIAGVSIIRDITKRKEMEHKLIQSEKLKSLGELAGGVAHDFNNVLAAIMGRAQLLKMNVEPPQGEQERRKMVYELKKGLEIIERASKDGAETVRRIQEFARRRDEDKYFTTINLNEIIENALEFTKVRWKDDAESKGIKINIQKEFSSLAPISGSAAELREVFTNLINNAIDAMPQGGNIKIKTFKKDSHISIKVKDTGVGIPKVMRDRIFDPFFTTRGVKSSGLGLSVSYGIINRHQGTITVDSVEGQGTSFIIKLPISEKVIEAEQVKPIPEEKRKARILVIEDEEDVLDILSDILINGGYEVETATDGSKGIKLFEKKEFDLIFTDLGMPGMSGWQVAEKVKGINRKVPVALITGWNVELNESEMRESGIDLLVYKPFEVNQVLRLVQEGMVLRDRFKAA